MPRYVIGNVEIPVVQTTATNAVADPAALAVEVQTDSNKNALKAAQVAAAQTDEQISALFADKVKLDDLAKASAIPSNDLKKALLAESKKRSGVVAPPADGGSGGGGGSLLVYGSIAAIVGYFAWKKSKQSKASA